MNQNRDFRETSFNHQDLTDANFSQVNLANADFSYAILKGANFSKANLTSANFQDANLTDSDFSYAILKNANLMETNIRGCDFSYATLLNANLDSAKTGKSFTKGFLIIIKSVMFSFFWVFTNWGNGNGSYLDIDKSYKSIGTKIVMGVTSLIGAIVFSNSIFVAIENNNLVREIASSCVALICLIFSIFTTVQSINLIIVEIDTKFYKTNLTNANLDNIYLKNIDFTDAILNDFE